MLGGMLRNLSVMSFPFVVLSFFLSFFYPGDGRQLKKNLEANGNSYRSCLETCKDIMSL